MDRLPQAVCERGLNDGLDRSQSRSAGDSQNQAGVPLPQESAAERPADLDRMAASELGRDLSPFLKDDPLFAES